MYSVLLVGLGNIGAGYDIENTSPSHVLSHAKAFIQHPKFKVIGGVDQCFQARLRFEAHFNIPCFKGITEAREVCNPDLIVVASPTDTHLKIIRHVFKIFTPKAILCEKPMGRDLIQAQEIVNLCERYECRLYVNFFRASEPGVIELQKRISDGEIQCPVKGVVWYSKGIVNSGSHFIHLLNLLLGNVKGIRVLSSGRLWDGKDPEPNVDIEFVEGRVTFLNVEAENFFYNSLELVTVNGVLKYDFGGAEIRWFEREAGNLYNKNRNLSQNCEIIETDFNRYQAHVVEQLAYAMNDQRARIATSSQAILTHQVLQEIMEGRHEYVS